MLYLGQSGLTSNERVLMPITSAICFLVTILLLLMKHFYPRAPSHSAPHWNTGQNYYHKSYSSQAHQRPSNVVITSRISPPGFPAKASQAQDYRSTRSPPAFSDEEPLIKSRSVNVR